MPLGGKSSLRKPNLECVLLYTAIGLDLQNSGRGSYCVQNAIDVHRYHRFYTLEIRGLVERLPA